VIMNDITLSQWALTVVGCSELSPGAGKVAR
jgi:hypothetical protein